MGADGVRCRHETVRKLSRRWTRLGQGTVCKRRIGLARLAWINSIAASRRINDERNCRRSQWGFGCRNPVAMWTEKQSVLKQRNLSVFGRRLFHARPQTAQGLLACPRVPWASAGPVNFRCDYLTASRFYNLTFAALRRCLHGSKLVARREWNEKTEVVHATVEKSVEEQVEEMQNNLLNPVSPELQEFVRRRDEAQLRDQMELAKLGNVLKVR